MGKRKLLLLELAFLLAATVPGLAVPEVSTKSAGEGDKEEAAPPALQRRNPRYRLGKGDVLNLHFPFTPEFQQTVTVQPDGYISLRGTGDLHVEGLTTEELQERLREVYSKILHDPEINVDLREFARPHFVVGGEVAKPGKYDLRGDTTVAQAVFMAGGFSQKAKHSQVLVFRRVSNDWAEVTKVDLKKMLRSGNLREDLHLRNGDMLFVPQSRISKLERYLPLPRLTLWFGIRPL